MSQVRNSRAENSLCLWTVNSHEPLSCSLADSLTQQQPGLLLLQCINGGEEERACWREREKEGELSFVPTLDQPLRLSVFPLPPPPSILLTIFFGFLSFPFFLPSFTLLHYNSSFFSIFLLFLPFFFLEPPFPPLNFLGSFTICMFRRGKGRDRRDIHREKGK